MLRTISNILPDEKNNNELTRSASNGNTFIVVECEPEIQDGVLMSGERVSFFADEKLLAQVKPGMKIHVKG